MKTLSLALIIFFFSLTSCGDKAENKNTQAFIVKLVLEADGKDFNVDVPYSVFTIGVTLPYGTTETQIKTLELSPGATADRKAGDIFAANSGQVEITVTSEDKNATNTYELTLSVPAEPNVVSTHGLLKVS